MSGLFTIEGLAWVAGAVVAYLILQGIAWLILFRLRYFPHLVRFFEDIPMMSAAKYRPEPDREDVEIHSADGITLRGSYLAAETPQRRGVLLFCHELNGDRWNALPYVRSLREQGFDVFAFDFRQHGASERVPDYQPVPWITTGELVDLEAVLDYLVARPDHDGRGVASQGLGVIGVSRGANAALCLAAMRPEVKAVVTDGAFPMMATLLHSVRRWMRIYTSFEFFYRWIPDWLFAIHLEWVVRVVHQRVNHRYVRPERFVGQVRQPVFQIHGQQDNFIPVAVAKTFGRQIPGRRRFWVVERAKHNRAIETAPELYQQRLLAFFGRHLSDDAPPEELAEFDAAATSDAEYGLVCRGG